MHSANGDAFSGDFMVTSLSCDRRRLEVAVVDVSGKGRGAGARSLLLSGALSGILGSVGAFSFLSAANSFLIRQRWGEGFATAAHLDLDLETGSYSVGLAGHPAPAHYHAGTATWEMVGTQGPLLGVMDRVFFPRASGRLLPGDALLLYTDGVVESRQYDLDDGIDRMLGVASQVMVRGGSGPRRRRVPVGPLGSDGRPRGLRPPAALTRGGLPGQPGEPAYPMDRPTPSRLGRLPHAAYAGGPCPRPFPAPACGPSRPGGAPPR